MKKGLEAIIHQAARMPGGIDPGHHKDTAERETVLMPPPERVVLAMQQHIGAPCKPIVKKGDAVSVGQLIAQGEGLSVPVHASVSGVTGATLDLLLPSGQHCEGIEILSDGRMTPYHNLSKELIDRVKSPAQLIEAAKSGGLVGLGGAGFPVYAKLRSAADQKADTLILNGAECEPFITSDYRECIERPQDIMEGIYLLKRIMGFKNVIIAIENNKPKAIEILRKIASENPDADHKVNVMALRTRYPQGAEKTLVYTATRRKVPFGKLPADVGCTVMNINTVSALYRYLRTGMPLVSKRITVDGSAALSPVNAEVPVGTSVHDVIEFCGGASPRLGKILMGGPMMGIALRDDGLPILKQTNSLTLLDRKDAVTPEPTPCIRCGRCVYVCPVDIMPESIEKAMKPPQSEENANLLKNLYADYCIECGCCSYICPARRPLTQSVRLAKQRIKKEGVV